VLTRGARICISFRVDTGILLSAGVR